MGTSRVLSVLVFFSRFSTEWMDFETWMRPSGAASESMSLQRRAAISPKRRPARNMIPQKTLRSLGIPSSDNTLSTSRRVKIAPRRQSGSLSTIFPNSLWNFAWMIVPKCFRLKPAAKVFFEIRIHTMSRCPMWSTPSAPLRRWWISRSRIGSKSF